MKRLTQLEAWAIFTIQLGLPLNMPKNPRFDAESLVEKMIRRGLLRRFEGKVVVTVEGQAAMKRWEGK